MQILKCGCAENALVWISKVGDYVKCCFQHNTTEKMEPQPDLSKRVMRCSSCGRESASDKGAPFFIYEQYGAKDRFYCGCAGWS